MLLESWPVQDLVHLHWLSGSHSPTVQELTDCFTFCSGALTTLTSPSIRTKSQEKTGHRTRGSPATPPSQLLPPGTNLPAAAPKTADGCCWVQVDGGCVGFFKMVVAVHSQCFVVSVCVWTCVCVLGSSEHEIQTPGMNSRKTFLCPSLCCAVIS